MTTMWLWWRNKSQTISVRFCRPRHLMITTNFQRNTIWIWLWWRDNLVVMCMYFNCSVFVINGRPYNGCNEQKQNLHISTLESFFSSAEIHVFCFWLHYPPSFHNLDMCAWKTRTAVEHTRNWFCALNHCMSFKGMVYVNMHILDTFIYVSIMRTLGAFWKYLLVIHYLDLGGSIYNFKCSAHDHCYKHRIHPTNYVVGSFWSFAEDWCWSNLAISFEATSLKEYAIAPWGIWAHGFHETTKPYTITPIKQIKRNPCIYLWGILYHLPPKQLGLLLSDLLVYEIGLIQWIFIQHYSTWWSAFVALRNLWSQCIFLWDRMYASGNWVSLSSDNGLSPIRRQAII